MRKISWEGRCHSGKMPREKPLRARGGLKTCRQNLSDDAGGGGRHGRNNGRSQVEKKENQENQLDFTTLLIREVIYENNTLYLI